MSYNRSRGYSGEQRSSGSKRGWGILALLVLIAAVFLAPWGPIHWMFMILYTSWPILASLAVLSILSILAIGTTKSKLVAGGCVFAIFAFFIVAGLTASGMSQARLVKAIQPQMLDALPNTQGVRYMPMAVALKTAQNAYQDPKNGIAEGMDPFVTSDGQLAWVGARVPTGPINSLTATQPGVVTVSEVGKLSIVDQEFTCGEGMAITDEITWAIWRKNFFADLGEPYYAQADDELLMIVPYISWHLDFPVTVPAWGGVMVVHGNCNIEDLSPQQAQQDPRLTGIRIVPEEFAKAVADAWAYRGGVWNAWFTHTDQTEIPQIEGESNQMPYLIPTGDGPVWFTAMEPYGPAFSVYRTMFMNARTGEVSMYDFPKDANIASPNRVGDYIRTSQPTFNWFGGEGQGGNMVVIEPRPLVREGVLYWMMTLTSVEHSSINATYLMRSTDQAIFVAANLGELKAFVAGTRTLQQIMGETAPTTSSSTADGSTPVSSNTDLTQLSEQQLRDLINAAIDELTRR